MLLHYLLNRKIGTVTILWFIRRKAFWMSQNVPPTDNVLFIACSVSFINLCEASSVEEFLQNPQCSSDIILVLYIRWHSLSYIASSRTLENEINCALGLLLDIQILSIFLNNGFISVHIKWNKWIQEAGHLLYM